MCQCSVHIYIQFFFFLQWLLLGELFPLPIWTSLPLLTKFGLKSTLSEIRKATLVWVPTFWSIIFHPFSVWCELMSKVRLLQATYTVVGSCFLIQSTSLSFDWRVKIIYIKHYYWKVRTDSCCYIAFLVWFLSTVCFVFILSVEIVFLLALWIQKHVYSLSEIYSFLCPCLHLEFIRVQLGGHKFL